MVLVYWVFLSLPKCFPLLILRLVLEVIFSLVKHTLSNFSSSSERNIVGVGIDSFNTEFHVDVAEDANFSESHLKAATSVRHPKMSFDSV